MPSNITLMKMVWLEYAMSRCRDTRGFAEEAAVALPQLEQYFRAKRDELEQTQDVVSGAFSEPVAAPRKPEETSPQ